MNTLRLAAAIGTAIVLSACAAPMHCEVEAGRARLIWEPIMVPVDASDVRYEVAVHEAEQGLPVRRVRFVEGLGSPACDAGHLPPGDYVWSVRARYRRLDRDWVTRWLTMPNTPAVAVEPQRGFCPLTIAR